MEEQNISQGERAVQGLLKLIQDGDYTPGEKLPTEPELAKYLGVSKNMVREALRVLVSRNIVVIRQGAGTFIAQKPGVVEDPFGFRLYKDKRKVVEDTLQIRSILEPSIAALAAEKRTEEELQKLQGILLQMEALMHDKKDYFELDARFHEQIAIMSHNILMENLIPGITEGVRLFAREVSETEYDMTMISHRKIFSAIRDQKAVEAQQAMMYHILYNNERYDNEGAGN